MAGSQALEGRQAVREALVAGRPVDKLYYYKGATGLADLLKMGRAVGVVLIECDRDRLDAMSETGAHQGVLATVAEVAYHTVDEILDRAQQSGRPPLLVVCDGVEDPRNLGAIMRTAEAAGAHGVIIPKRRSASLSAGCAKAAAGALERIPVARVPGIPMTLRSLKKGGIWVYGADMAGKNVVFDTELLGPAAFVLGSEGSGLSRLCAAECDYLVKIPMLGELGSLNVSAAAAVLLYEAVRQRRKTGEGMA